MTDGMMRTETDSMGPMQVPASALYGASTARAVENFRMSGYRLPEAFLRALGLVKHACALANVELGELEARKGKAIADAALAVWRGQHLEHFPLDVFQTGSATSTNMNANEVIANLATRALGGEPGDRTLVHPNDDVNKQQSSNDVIPSALHVAALLGIESDLVPALRGLLVALADKAVRFAAIVKPGRTHLMDATPVRLGQVFQGYASQVEHALGRLAALRPDLQELALGGTAVGTGLNRRREFPARAIAHVNAATGLAFRAASDHFEAMGAKDALVQASGVLRTVAVGLSRIAHDLRQMGSGPRCGIGEIKLPPLQPGSSIMPGKVNPVLPESLLMVCAWVIGNDTACTLAGLGGFGGGYELNTMMPLLAHNVLESIRVLAATVGAFTARCVVGLEADAARCQELVDRSLMNVTRLVPILGYDKAAELAKRALDQGRTLRDVVLAERLVEPAVLDRLLDPKTMTEPQP